MAYTTQLVALIAEAQYELADRRRQLLTQEVSAQAVDVVGLDDLREALRLLRDRLRDVEDATGPVGHYREAW